MSFVLRLLHYSFFVKVRQRKLERTSTQSIFNENNLIYFTRQMDFHLLKKLWYAVVVRGKKIGFIKRVDKD